MASHNERRIATEILKTVRRLELPIKLDEITEGKGNCFPLAIIAQCRRPEVFDKLSDSLKNLIYQNDPTLFRQEVHQFMTKSRNPTIQNFKRRYEDVISAIDERNWDEYWQV